MQQTLLLLSPEAAPRLTSADPTQPNANAKYNSAADYHLADRGPKISAHEAVADKGDCNQFADDNGISYVESNAQIRNQKRKGVEHSADRRCDPSDGSLGLLQRSLVRSPHYLPRICLDRTSKLIVS
jgi:hypothetical protein